MATTTEPNFNNNQNNQESHSRPTFISIVQNHVAYHVAGNHAVNKLLLMAGDDALTATVEEAYGMMVSAGVGFGKQQRHPPHAVVGIPTKKQAMEFVRANIEYELQRRKAMFAHMAMQSQTNAMMHPGFVCFPAANNNINIIPTRTTSQPKESSSVQQAAQQRTNELLQEQIKRLQEANKERLQRMEKMERLVQDLQQKDTDGQQQVNEETTSSSQHLQNEVKALRNWQKDCQDRLESRVTGLSHLVKSYQETMIKLDSETKSHLATPVTTLVALVTKCQQSVQGLETRVSEANQCVEESQRNLAASEQARKVQAETIQRLESKMEELIEENKRTRDAPGACQQDTKGLESQVEQLKMALQAILGDKKRVESLFRRDLSQVQRDLSRIESRVGQLVDSKQRTSDALDASQQNTLHLGPKFAEANQSTVSALVACIREVELLKTANQSTANALEAGLRDTKRVESQVKELVDQNKRTGEAFQAGLRDKKRVESQVKELVEDKKRTDEALQAGLRDKKRLESQVQELAENNKRTADGLDACQRENKRLKTQMEQLETAETTIRRERPPIERRLELLEDSNRDVRIHMHRLQQIVHARKKEWGNRRQKEVAA